MSVHPDLKFPGKPDPSTEEGRQELRLQLYSTLEDKCRDASTSMDAVSVIVKVLGDEKLSVIMSEMAEKQRDWGKRLRTLAIDLEVERQRNKK